MTSKVYLVGGAVRDMVMGREPKDKDYVVVGSSEEQMKNLGFSKVGASFPVFLHPITGEEYALARTEKKVAAGYHGFITMTENVTLEMDLMRRDFTFGSMAYDESSKTIIDPYGGQDDIKNRTIRHTSDAFSEDPLRVIRAVRFAARYDFMIAKETCDLMSKMLKEGQLNEIHPNRILLEIEKGMQDNPNHFISLMFKFNMHKYIDCLKGVLRQNTTVWYVDPKNDAALNAAVYLDVQSTDKIASSMSFPALLVSEFVSVVNSLKFSYTHEADEIYNIIKKFRLYDHINAYAWLCSMDTKCSSVHSMLKSCSKTWKNINVPESGNIGEQIKQQRLTNIKTFLDEYDR